MSTMKCLLSFPFLVAVGVDAANWVQVNTYKESTCTTLIKSAWWAGSTTGICTVSPLSSLPYSWHATNTKLKAYSTTGCTGTALMTFDDLTDCVLYGSIYYKVVTFAAAEPKLYGPKGYWTASYTGTDATTATCVTKGTVGQISYQHDPLNTCIPSGTQYYKIMTCALGGNYTYQIYTNSACTTKSGTAISKVALKACKVSNNGLTSGGNYEKSEYNQCGTGKVAGTASISHQISMSLVTSIVAFMAFLM